MSIDPAQPIPIYFQLKTLLLEEILGGRYGPQDRLPTEHELCEQYRISRTPVTRALSELAEEGIILRHRRRGSFVNPHWLSRRPDQREVRVVVPAEGPWAGMIRDAAGGNNQVSILTVPRESLHQMLTHAVAEGVAPDLAVIDSVWTPEFAAAGFLHALEDLDEDWIRDEHEVDFLEPLAGSNRYGGRTFGIPRLPTWRASGTASASSRGGASSRPARGPSCVPLRERSPTARCLTQSSCPGARKAARRRPTA